MNVTPDLQPLRRFLKCETPKAWLEKALVNMDTLLIDHAHCERKAAQSAMSLMGRYPENYDLLQQMSRLAREELRHFEMVLALMKRRKIAFKHLLPSRYAQYLYEGIMKHEPNRFVDQCIIGAIIEARSCERFACLIPHLDDELAEFYQSLLKSEARHFEHYLGFAKDNASVAIDERIDYFTEREAAYILSPDDCFRFHSGI